MHDHFLLCVTFDNKYVCDKANVQKMRIFLNNFNKKKIQCNRDATPEIFLKVPVTDKLYCYFNRFVNQKKKTQLLQLPHCYKESIFVFHLLHFAAIKQ